MTSQSIVIGLSPNTDSTDILTSLKVLCQPWNWKAGRAIHHVESWFRDYFHITSANSFNAGRSALFALLRSCNFSKNSEVLIQAFTCVAVPNSVIWAGLKPVYVDIDETLNLDVVDAKLKLTKQTRVLIVQHTFGIPADMDKILAFCRNHQLLLIEDCAHALGATYKGKLLGTFGDAAIFSFGRDKIVSSVFGGMAIVNQNSRIKMENLLSFQQKLSFPSYFWIFQQLIHPIVVHLALQLYNMGNIGKGLLWLAQKLRLVSLPVLTEERLGHQPPEFPKPFPNALAYLLLNQLRKLESMNRCRLQIAERYWKKLEFSPLTLPYKIAGAVYLRFNVLLPKADNILQKAKKRGIILGNWYRHIIDPIDTDLSKVGYISGSCPRAEKAARMSLNLPTYPRLLDIQVERICQLVKYV